MASTRLIYDTPFKKTRTTGLYYHTMDTNTSMPLSECFPGEAPPRERVIGVPINQIQLESAMRPSRFGSNITPSEKFGRFDKKDTAVSTTMVSCPNRTIITIDKKQKLLYPSRYPVPYIGQNTESPEVTQIGLLNTSLLTADIVARKLEQENRRKKAIKNTYNTYT